MATVTQLVKGVREKRKRKWKFRALQKCPQKKGVCLRVFTVTPRKPNSGLRKVARVRLTNNFRLTGYIIGEGHNLQKYSNVLVRAGSVRDVPGVRYKFVRGKYDFEGLAKRMKKRSKYGTKKWDRKA